MEVKLFEIRDEMTCIPAIAIKLEARSEEERWLLGRAGYGEQSCYVLFGDLNLTMPITYDPYKQRSKDTMGVAHEYIQADWDNLESGAVIDVRVILGKQSEPVVSDRIWEIEHLGM